MLLVLGLLLLEKQRQVLESSSCIFYNTPNALLIVTRLDACAVLYRI